MIPKIILSLFLTSFIIIVLKKISKIGVSYVIKFYNICDMKVWVLDLGSAYMRSYIKCFMTHKEI